MDPYTTNPYMYILEADPGKYIRTSSAAIVALIKAAEGVLAFLCFPRLYDFFKMMLSGGAVAAPLEILRVLLPGECAAVLLPQELSDGGTLGKVLCWIILACVFLALLCMVIEAVAAVLLRFVLRGAKLLNITQKVLFIISIVLLPGVLVSCVPLVRDLTQSGIQLHQVFLSGNTGMFEPFRPLLVTFCCAILLWPRISYHRGMITVFSVIAYEIRRGFKDTAIGDKHLSKYALLLGVLSLAIAAAAGYFVGWMTVYAGVPFVIAIKYFFVYSCWGDFRRCHQ